MNIGKIGYDSYSFYNSASRLGNINRNDVQAVDSSKDVNRNTEIDSQKIAQAPAQSESRDFGGLQRTQVSADNAYQKQMISDPKFAMERMASKLMDKLPQIFKDMSRVPDLGAEATVAPEKAATASKQIISENDYLERQAENAKAQEDALADVALQNFSL